MSSSPLSLTSPPVSSENKRREDNKSPLKPADMAQFQSIFRSLFGLGRWPRLPGHLIAQTLQTLDELTLHLVTIRLPEKLLSFVMILLPGGHHLIVDHQNIMSDCQSGAFTAPPFFQATVALSQIRFGATHSMGGLDQSRPHIAIALLTTSAEALACTFLVPGTDASPRTEVLGIREAREVGSYLGHQHLYDLPTHPRNVLTALDLFLKRGDPAHNFLLHMRDRPTLRLNQAEQLA